MMAGASIEVKGLEKTLNALKVIDPDAMKAFRQGFKVATQPIVNKAKARVPSDPMSGWGSWSGRLNWDQSKAKSGIRSQVSVTKRRAILRLRSNNAAAAVYENAGSKSPNSPFVKALIKKNHGDPPRLLVKTWKQEKGIRAVHVRVGKLIADAEERVQRAVR